MQITLWGVRGSYPAPGAATVEFGGNTPCIEVQAGDSRVIVDAGTGIYRLGRLLAGQPAHYHILFTHVHWDHIQGLPFFAPLHDPGTRLTIHAAPRFLPFLQELLGRGIRQVYLPIAPSRLRAQIDFQTFRIGQTFEIGAIEVGTVNLNHPYHCVGFRFRSSDRSAVFYSDTAPFRDILFGYEYRPRAPFADETPDPYEHSRLAEMRQKAVELSEYADLLIHDAHFTPQEYQQFAHFGHSTPEHALDIALAAQVKRLLLFHHAPARDDDTLAKIEAHYHSVAAERGMTLDAAREGERISL